MNKYNVRLCIEKYVYYKIYAESKESAILEAGRLYEDGFDGNFDGEDVLWYEVDMINQIGV